MRTATRWSWRKMGANGTASVGTAVALLMCLSFALSQELSKANVDGKSGRRNVQADMYSFVIGGWNTYPGEFPFYVQMYWSGAFVGCGGSLVASKWVLTAAHCVARFATNDRSVVENPEWRVGMYCLSGNNHGPNCGARENVRRSRRILVHPRYSETNRALWDFALVELDSAVDEIPVTIDDGSTFSTLEEGDSVKNIGFGWVSDDQEFPEFLQYVSSYFLPVDQCGRHFAGGRNFDESIFCTNGHDLGTCRGDSGSPTMVSDSKSPTRWVQIGVTSFGSYPCENHNIPDGFARVSSAFPWIEAVICASYTGVSFDVPEFCPSTIKSKKKKMDVKAARAILTSRPTSEPTNKPTRKPTSRPSFRPTRRPRPPPKKPPAVKTQKPTLRPSREPTAEPTNNPTKEPTNEPTNRPSSEPTSEPSNAPTAEPSSEPTSEPTNEPSSEPTNKPSAEPTSEPTVEPTSEPTVEPTSEPTSDPTHEPSSDPTKEPTVNPTDEPTRDPTAKPTRKHTLKPTAKTIAQQVVATSGSSPHSAPKVKQLPHQVVTNGGRRTSKVGSQKGLLEGVAEESDSDHTSN